MIVSSEFVRECVFEAGFSLCGIARSRLLSEHQARFEHWLGKGYCGGLEYLTCNGDKRLDPAALVERAETVIVCAVNYKNTAWDQCEVGVAPHIASYAYMRDYHIEIKKMLKGVLERIRQQYPGAEGRFFSDSAPVLEKAWAAEAGLGWIGKNSLLITPRFGSFVLLGELILNVEADVYDAPFGRERCGTCTACIDRCPARAIRSPRVIDAGRCISRMTIEKMPDGVTYSPDLLHGWIFGCDECQSCCPYNRDTPMHTLPAFEPLIDPTETTPNFWADLTQEEFARLFSAGPMMRTGYKVIKDKVETLLKTP